jgi:hypothetical protein
MFSVSEFASTVYAVLLILMATLFCAEAQDEQQVKTVDLSQLLPAENKTELMTLGHTKVCG